MSDLRHDPIDDRWVSIARNRRDRPMEFVPMEQLRQQLICPFCKGNEDETPDALAAYKADGTLLAPNDDSSNWTVRVIPNRYPSFSSYSQATRDEPDIGTLDYGPYQSNRSHGIQELVIPSSRHVTSLSELTDVELKLSFLAFQDRFNHARALKYVKHAMLFMNCRLAAGASLGHIHTQLIGSPIVSNQLVSRVERNEAHFQQHGHSMLMSLAEWEIDQKARIVEVTDNFCIVCPFASRFAFQVWIIPRADKFDFVTCSDVMRDELAMHCRNLVSRLETVLDHPAYNLLLHADPFAISDKSHSYFELFPRLTRAAGFEWGADIWVNPVAPESAARRLRVEE